MLHARLRRQFLALAEQQKATAPIMIGHRLLANTLLCMGDVAEGLSHLDRALALYDPAVHRPLATRFGHDIGVAILTFRPLALWLLGYPKTALVETDRAINAARETGHAPTLMFALALHCVHSYLLPRSCGSERTIDECIALAEEKGAVFLKALATAQRGCVLAHTGKASDAIQTISAAITAYRSTGQQYGVRRLLSYLALAYAELGKFDDAWRCIGEAMSSDRNNQGKVVRGRDQSHRRGNRAEVARAGCGKSAKRISSVRSRSRASNRQSPGNCAPR